VPIQLTQPFDHRTIRSIEDFLAGYAIIEKVGLDRIDCGRERQGIEEPEERTKLMLGHEVMQMAPPVAARITGLPTKAS
jgi:hypothetical protein